MVAEAIIFFLGFSEVGGQGRAQGLPPTDQDGI